MRFSERIGVVKRVLQKDSIDNALRNSLWNAAFARYWLRYQYSSTNVASLPEGHLIVFLWTQHFDQPLDKLSPGFSRAIDVVTRFEKSDWHSVYDFVEAVAQSRAPHVREFIAECNSALERHMSAYRFIGATLSPITSEEEIAAVEVAVGHGDKFAPASAHIGTALSHLSSRTSPDYR